MLVIKTHMKEVHGNFLAELVLTQEVRGCGPLVVVVVVVVVFEMIQPHIIRKTVLLKGLTSSISLKFDFTVNKK